MSIAENHCYNLEYAAQQKTSKASSNLSKLILSHSVNILFARKIALFNAWGNCACYFKLSHLVLPDRYKVNGSWHFNNEKNSMVLNA